MFHLQFRIAKACTGIAAADDAQISKVEVKVTARFQRQNYFVSLFMCCVRWDTMENVIESSTVVDAVADTVDIADAQTTDADSFTHQQADNAESGDHDHETPVTSKAAPKSLLPDTAQVSATMTAAGKTIASGVATAVHTVATGTTQAATYISTTSAPVLSNISSSVASTTRKLQANVHALLEGRRSQAASPAVVDAAAAGEAAVGETPGESEAKSVVGGITIEEEEDSEARPAVSPATTPASAARPRLPSMPISLPTITASDVAAVKAKAAQGLAATGTAISHGAGVAAAKVNDAAAAAKPFFASAFSQVGSAFEQAGKGAASLASQAKSAVAPMLAPPAATAVPASSSTSATFTGSAST